MVSANALNKRKIDRGRSAKATIMIVPERPLPMTANDKRTVMPLQLSAYGRIARPTVEHAHLRLRQPCAGVVPHLDPDPEIGNDAFWMLPAARNKTRKSRASGGLADGLVAQVETPSNLIAQVSQRRMFVQAMHEQDTAFSL